ncbi:hypothetical protein NUU61_003029 [Penicillium alfredii]|uniref:CCHC-type domain-containing protein n=1 Tax=Penicillium alfredii TaxID=1506179 RepID=A0A9W9FTR6_9EURO|nr:uncharacterized protein NUU61_005263 [Penicillium alfredii]XP_056514678.1 uncharacterized protein NUU61_003029 [Penicillium alfredii]KAJ5095907.1 hypothetical protein NUU61_005263 [Penicillium alfredii]KAJ5105682.1 hypothetical protein NUU61_003029 [Penicillium alfredii]
MDALIDFAVRIDNRFHDRQMQKREVEGWRRGNGRPSHQRFQPQRTQQPRSNDPYGPRPMELDAVRLPEEEQRRRKENNLCFKCGKPGHRSRECKKRNDKPHQMRATNERLDRGAYDTTGIVKAEKRTQQLCATREQGREGPVIVDGSKPPPPKQKTLRTRNLDSEISQLRTALQKIFKMSRLKKSDPRMNLRVHVNIHDVLVEATHDTQNTTSVRF